MKNRKPIDRTDGFSLVELLVSLAIFGVLTTAIYGLLISQRNSYRTQDQILEMQQNGRAALNAVLREFRMAGYNAMGGQLTNNLSDWVPTNFIPTSPLTVNLDANPKITLGTGNQPDMITFLSMLDSATNPTTLAPPSADPTATIIPAGATTIYLSLSSSEMGQQYHVDEDGDNGDIIHIGIGSEYAKVKSRSGISLTIDTNPSLTGNQGLARSYPVGTEIGEVSVVSYAVFNTGDYAAHPVLMRKINGDDFEPVAENISNMQITASGTGEVQLSLTARTARPDPDFAENSGFRTFDLATTVKLRNADTIATGSTCNLPGIPSAFSLGAGLDATNPCRIETSWNGVTSDGTGVALESGCEVISYRIYFDTMPGVYAHAVDVGTATSHNLDLTSLPGWTYYVAVAARNSAGLGPKSSELSKIDATAPAAPSGFAASVEDRDNQVYLTWSPNTECDLNGYRIYRSDASSEGPYTQIAELGKAINSYLDSNLLGCKTYYYRLQALDYRPNLSNPASASATTTDSIAPAMPLNLALTSASGTDTLTWDASTDDGAEAKDVKSYEILGDGTLLHTVTQVGQPNYSFSTATPDPPYASYGVKAVDNCGNESTLATTGTSCSTTVQIASPGSGSHVSGIITISGAATASEGTTLSTVKIRIGTGGWQDATLASGSGWTFSWDTTGFSDGAYSVVAVATDSAGCNATGSANYVVENNPTCTLQVVVDGCKPTGNEEVYARIRILKNGNPVTADDGVSATWRVGNGGPWNLTRVSDGYFSYNGSGTSECGGYEIFSKSPSNVKYRDNELPVTVQVTPTMSGCNGSGAAVATTITAASP